MRRRILMILLAAGTIGFYAMGFAQMRHGACQRDSFERHVAKVCTEAAQDTRNEARDPRAGTRNVGHAVQTADEDE